MIYIILLMILAIYTEITFLYLNPESYLAKWIK